MDKIKSPKFENIPSPKVSGISDKAFGIIKLVLGVFLLPFVYSTTLSFLNELSAIEKRGQNYFWTGIIGFLIIYLFIWEPVLIYAKGQKILEFIFSFFKSLVKVAPYLLPIYTILLFILYGLLSLIYVSQAVFEALVFLFGFSISMHLVFSAKSLRSKKGDFLKSNYIFGFSFVYIINVLLLSFCLSFVFDKFSFVNFSNNSFQFAKGIFEAVFRQLFNIK